MSWERAFISQSYGRPIYKHEQLSVYITDEFNFFRCVEFKADFYGKTASTLFNGNLRICSETNRYAKLFPNQKLSYWADSPDTARAEIKKHGAGSNILTFWAYGQYILGKPANGLGNRAIYQPAASWTIGALSSIYSAMRRNSSAYLNFTLILPPS